MLSTKIEVVFALCFGFILLYMRMMVVVLKRGRVLSTALIVVHRL